MKQRYQGGCHCRKVLYEVNLELKDAFECNCSHCQIKGLLLIFVPATEFTLLSGEELLSDYRFNKGTIAHLFCKECGVEAFGKGKSSDGSETVAVNIRSLENIELAHVNRVPVDGKSW